MMTLFDWLWLVARLNWLIRETTPALTVHIHDAVKNVLTECHQLEMDPILYPQESVAGFLRKITVG
jgi:hypothetical protein